MDRPGTGEQTRDRIQSLGLPPPELVEAELRRERRKRQRDRRILISVLALLAAIFAVLALSSRTPLLRIYGGSMAPTLNPGELVITARRGSYGSGDMIGLTLGNRVLVKRVIAEGGQRVDITEDGTVYVDGKALDEPYLARKAKGECTITLPCQVPEGCYFVLGDHRSTSLDSRSIAVGFIVEEAIVGKVLFRIWPLNRLGRVN